jgi:uncharacterized membrane protein
VTWIEFKEALPVLVAFALGALGGALITFSRCSAAIIRAHERAADATERYWVIASGRGATEPEGDE